MWPRARKDMGRLTIVRPRRDKSYCWRQARWTTGIKRQITRARTPKVWERVMVALWGLRGGLSLTPRERHLRAADEVDAEGEAAQLIRELRDDLTLFDDTHTHTHLERWRGL